jgi:hypothetical protein
VQRERLLTVWASPLDAARLDAEASGFAQRLQHLPAAGTVAKSSSLPENTEVQR